MEKGKCTRNKTIVQKLEDIRYELNANIVSLQKLSSNLIDIVHELKKKEGEK